MTRPQAGRRMGRCRRPRRRCQAVPPRASWVPRHTTGRRPHAGRGAAYARSHSLTQLYAKRSQQLCSWAGGPGGTPSGLVTSPVVTFPSAGRALAPCGDRPASGAAGPRPPVQALRARTKGAEDDRGPAKGRRREKELAERTNRLAEKETRKALQNQQLHYLRCKKYCLAISRGTGQKQ